MSSFLYNVYLSITEGWIPGVLSVTRGHHDKTNFRITALVVLEINVLISSICDLQYFHQMEFS